MVIFAEVSIWRFLGTAAHVSVDSAETVAKHQSLGVDLMDLKWLTFVCYGLLVLGCELYFTRSYVNLFGKTKLNHFGDDEVFSMVLKKGSDGETATWHSEAFGNSVLDPFREINMTTSKMSDGDSDLDQRGDDNGVETDSNGAEQVREGSQNVSSNSKFSPNNVSMSKSFSKMEGIGSKSGVTLLRMNKKQAVVSITQMNSLLLHSRGASHSKNPGILSARDRELWSAKLTIQNSPEIKDKAAPGLHAAVFRNISIFLRSYELMERTMKVYIYKEGDKPIFHQPKLGGVYSSEGWFMKLLESNEMFTVKDPSKAHLFYLPFSSRMLKIAKVQQNIDIQEVLNNYVTLISQKYRFWNQTNGRDHFFVACHDLAIRYTRQPPIGNCIRALCNANLVRGFKIGRDSSFPATYLRSKGNHLMDAGGNPAKERPLLAFFSGSPHGNVRSILLQHWEDKEPDMKISGPMRRDDEGRKIYTELMKSSKYCICARGYEVHTPRMVEAIWYECVPVIVADNYVPPFFEALNWESFAVFVLEADIPNLRSILVAIPEERYVEMQARVKMVQRHFLWQTPAVKYDLFHMILHSVWHHRLLQIESTLML